MKNKPRLKKLALMPQETFENTLDQISDKGRAILKSIEEYKFSVEQTLRVIKNDPVLSNVVSDKKKNLDHAAQDIYNIVFEIENIDITSAYENHEEEVSDEDNESKDENEENEDVKNEDSSDSTDSQNSNNNDEKSEENDSNNKIETKEQIEDNVEKDKK